MDTRQQLDQIKPLLADAQDAYCHALASGDLLAIPEKKRVVNKYKKQISNLIKERMAQK